VLDHCSGIDLVLREGKVGETYNIGSSFEASIEELADRILELTGKPQSLKSIVSDRPGHDRRYLLDASKIREQLGWQPGYEFGEGLRETVEWYRNHRAWWEPLKKRAPVEETAWT
jgi:dTDP-glucose 4,6-dehydratase